MLRLCRSRYTIIRSILFWLCAMMMIKLTSLFYYDLQEHSIDSTSLALPYEDKRTGVREDNSTIISMNINRTVIQLHREFVREKNTEQLMLNKQMFSSDKTRYILLVQVHTRVVYLKKFIEMLRNVQMINQTLLIFSHDFIDPEINRLIAKIDFVPVRIIGITREDNRSIRIGDTNILSIFSTTLSRRISWS